MLHIETVWAVWAGDLAVCANHMDCDQMDAIDTGIAILEISLCRVSIPNICALCLPCRHFQEAGQVILFAMPQFNR